MLARISNALRPRDFIEEMWAHDLVDAFWNLIRVRRIQAAFLSNQVWYNVNEQASSLAEANPELKEGTEKEEMNKLLDSNSLLSWEERMERYPRANEKYEKFWAEAESTLDKDLIQANIVIRELNKIERIEHFIVIAQRRYDAVIRELDRHRFMQNQYDSIQNVVESEVKTVDSTVSKITNNQ